MNADGSGRRNLTRRPVDYGAQDGPSPAWSPDGRKIAFDRDGGGIFVMNADGSGQRRLTQFGRQALWSPDGRMIAFRSFSAGNVEIYVMNADGSRQRNLTRTPKADEFSVCLVAQADERVMTLREENGMKARLTITRRARGGGHADRCCGGRPRRGEATRGDRHEALAAEDVCIHAAAGRTPEDRLGHDQPQLPEHPRTRRDARRTEGHDLRRRCGDTHRKAGNPHDSRPERVGRISSETGMATVRTTPSPSAPGRSCAEPASTPESSGRGAAAM